MLIPVIASGFITSGCAIYPSPYFCLNAPWSVGTTLAGKMNMINQNYERWRQYVPPDTGSWLLPWARLNLDTLVFFFILLFVAIVVITGEKPKEIPGRYWIMALSTLGTIFIMLTVPARRFGLGYFALPPALMAPLYPRIAYPLIVIIPLAFQADPYTRGARFALLVICLIVYVLILFTQNSFYLKLATPGFIMLAALFPLKALVASGGSNIMANGKNYLFWLIPPEAKKTELEIWESKQVNDLKYTHSTRPYPDGRCWAAELPCTPWLLQENLKLRDPKRGLKAGVVRAEQVEKE
jgi:hypothetical protein